MSRTARDGCDGCDGVPAQGPKARDHQQAEQLAQRGDPERARSCSPIRLARASRSSRAGLHERQADASPLDPSIFLACRYYHGPPVWRPGLRTRAWSAGPYGVRTMRAFALPCRTSWMDSLTELRGLVS